MTRFAPFLWLAYLLVPVAGWGLFHGRPLGAFEGLALMGFLWVWWVRRDEPAFAVFAAVALVAKVALGLTLLAPRGLDARYYANSEFTAPAEKGTEPAGPTFTRTDRSLAFRGGTGADLPLYFLNDIKRFNFYLPNDPVREELPVSVTWEGWLRVQRTGLTRFYAHLPGGTALLSVGELSVTIPPSPDGWVGYGKLEAGFQPIRISLSIPRGASRAFEAGWTIDGREEPFAAGAVFRQPVGRARLAGDWLARMASTVLDLVLSGWLIVVVLLALKDVARRLIAEREVRAALAGAWAIAIVHAFLFARPFAGRMITLSGGDDWLNYETRARDIGMNGLWMLNGATLGQGQAFYQMPFYPYFVAATHWLFGDDLFGVFLIQRLLAGATVIALWRLTAVLFGERVGWAGLLAAFVIVYEKIAPWNGLLLTESLFVPLLCFWVLLLVKVGKGTSPSLSSAAAAGAIGGLATLTRSSLMLGWPFALALVAFSLGRTKRTLRIVAVIAAALLAVTSLATIRNWVVARQFVLVSTYGPINLFINNEPPKSMVTPPAHTAAYERLGLDPFTQAVVEYARQSPRAFFEGWRKRALYSLGWLSTLRPWSLFYALAWPTALLGVVIMLARPSLFEGPAPDPVSLIPFALALTHLALLISIDAGDRQLLAFYALLVPYLAIVVSSLYQGVWRGAGLVRQK